MLGHGPISGTPISALHSWSAYVHSESSLSAQESASTTFYAATHDFITRATDTPANQAFQGSLDASLVVRRSIVGADGFLAFSQTVSELSLINADGEYDQPADENSINGQAVTVKVGQAVAGAVVPYSEFEPLALLTGDRWRVNRQALTIATRDIAAKLDVPAQPSTYLGTGELEGGTELAGKRRPRGFGPLRAILGRGGNVTPTLVIAAEGLFQVNDGAVDEITDVYDGGIALNFTADYATVALLRAATIVPGQWASCNAQGYFLIGGVAFAQITCDFNGDASLSGYVETTADIVERLVLSATSLTADDLDGFTFERVNLDQPAAVAYYLGSDSSETVADAIKTLMAGIGGFAQLTTLGKLRVVRMEAPVAIAAATYDLNGGDLIEVDRADLPEGIDPPPRRRRVAYARNWTQQTNLYGQVSEGDPARADYLSKPYLLASTSDDDANLVLSDYPFAPDPEPVEAYFANEADAQTEAERLHVLYNSGFKLWRGRVKNALFVHQIGETVKFIDTTISPRLRLGSGRYVRLVEAGDDCKTLETELVGFG